MAMFFFHTENGRICRDAEGTELPDLRSARNEALVVLAQIVREDPDQFWRDRNFRLTVTDGAGLVLYLLDLSGISSPGACGA
ncbi:MAG: DUF6894 family protein [Phenylobacterium sp.]